ncbi:MAG: PAS domain-containing protein [Pirellulaceae bacterium]
MTASNSKDMIFENDGSQVRSVTGSGVLALAVAMTVLIGTMVYVMRAGDQIGRTHPQQIDAVMLFKLEITTAHLRLEQVLFGDRLESIDTAQRHFDEADWYARTLLRGGQSSEWTFRPLHEPEVREEVRALRQDLAEFRYLTDQRYKALTTSASSAEADQQYEPRFEELLEHADGIEEQIQRVHLAQQNTFCKLQLFLIGFSLLLAVFAAYVFHRYAADRKLAESSLQDSEGKFRVLYKSSSDAVMLLDEKGFFDCNAATLRIFGCDGKEKFCSRHPADLSPPTQPDGTDSTTLANIQSHWERLQVHGGWHGPSRGLPAGCRVG